MCDKIEGELRFPDLSENASADKAGSYKLMPFAELNNGVNPNVLASARVIMHLEKEQELPMCFLVVDYQYNFAVVSFYRTDPNSMKDKIQAGD